MKPEWRTSTVSLLCQSMREAQDYSATPILADALQEAGCDDAALLEALRGGRPFWSAERLVAQVYSDETAAAVTWVEGFVADLGEGGYPGHLPMMTYEMLMEGARAFNAGDEYPFGDGSMDWSNVSDERDHEFWAAFQKVTGTRIGFEIAGRGRAFFACNC
jgi:hypothetical protein